MVAGVSNSGSVYLLSLPVVALLGENMISSMDNWRRDRDERTSSISIGFLKQNPFFVLKNKNRIIKGVCENTQRNLMLKQEHNVAHVVPMILTIVGD